MKLKLPLMKFEIVNSLIMQIELFMSLVHDHPTDVRYLPEPIQGLHPLAGNEYQLFVFLLGKILKQASAVIARHR